MGLIDGRKAIAGVAALAIALGFADASRADTIEAALVRAYQNNPQLNAQRASVRATDENVPQALSGYRPRVAVTASVGEQYSETTTVSAPGERPPTYTRLRGHNAPRSVGATVTQNVFNGYQTANRVRAAESQVSSAREGLARAGTDGAAVGRDDLHGLSARRGHRRGSAQQRPRARADAQAGAGPLQRRRSHAHRRGAVGGTARRRPVAAADRRIQPEHDARELPPHHRQRADCARAGHSGGPVPAARRCRRRSNSA